MGKIKMTASQFFYQASYQSSAAETERGQFECHGPNCAAVSKPYNRSSCANSDSFLQTFEKISNANYPNRQSQPIDKEKYFSPITNTPNEKIDEDAPKIAVTHNLDILLPTERQAKKQNIEKHTLSMVFVLTEIINHLETLGISGLDGESGASIHSNEIQASIEGLAELKLQIDQLLKFRHGTYTGTKTQLAQLYNWVVNNQDNAEGSFRVDSFLSGFSNSGLNELDGLNHFVDKVALEQKFESVPFTEQPIKDPSSANSPEIYRSIESILMAVSRLKDEMAISEKAGLPAPTNPNERIPLTILSGNLSNSESNPMNLPDTQSPTALKTASEGLKELASGQEQRSTSYTAQDANLNLKSSSLSKMADDVKLAKISAGEGVTAAEKVRMEALDIESQHGKKFNGDARTTRAFELTQRFGSESSPFSGGNAEASLVSKMIYDAQIAKENQMKMGDPMIGETVGKVTKVDAGSDGSGLPGSQHQLTEKTFEFTSFSKQANLDQDGVRTQTLDQIVRKAAIYMRNGQHEAKIELKPEYLGHIRMQVTTENHQVTVKILTEFGFVKEMVENNIFQLKADLQQQGLQVDKLEVAVSSDSDEHEHSQEKSGRAKSRQHGEAHTNSGNVEKESSERRQAADVGRLNADELTVDYFV
ncbi:MAG: flagellar hook-length control protein FliK [Desulfobacterales bacterium]